MDTYDVCSLTNVSLDNTTSPSQSFPLRDPMHPSPSLPIPIPIPSPVNILEPPQLTYGSVQSYTKIHYDTTECCLTTYTCLGMLRYLNSRLYSLWLTREWELHVLSGLTININGPNMMNKMLTWPLCNKEMKQLTTACWNVMFWTHIQIHITHWVRTSLNSFVHVLH